MERLKAYISGPISNGGKATPEERLENVRAAVRVFLDLVAAGFAPLCPQLTEFVERLSGQQLPHSAWMEVDLPWVGVADCILRLPGDSKGSDIEVEAAESQGIPVFHTIDDVRAFAVDMHDFSYFDNPEELAAK